jgi:hypothetical protein
MIGIDALIVAMWATDGPQDRQDIELLERARERSRSV